MSIREIKSESWSDFAHGQGIEKLNTLGDLLNVHGCVAKWWRFTEVVGI